MNDERESPIWLASRSPRRRLLLEQAGIDVRVLPSDVDDSDLEPTAVQPEQWVMALAYLKGRRVLERLHARGERAGLVLAADTVCVHRDEIFGQPCDAGDARRMLRAMQNATHRTLTGVALLSVESASRRVFFDEAEVHVGELSDAEIGRYVATGDWQGKAGAYNLSERLDAGWPIRCDGDPTTVMGLPMRKLTKWLGCVGQRT